MSRGALAKPPQHWAMDAGGDRGGVPSTSRSAWAGAAAGCEAEGSGRVRLKVAGCLGTPGELLG